MHNGQSGFRLATKRVLQNLGQSRLSFRHPARIVLADRLFIIAEQISNIGDGHATLQQDARERVPEAVRCGFLGADVSELEHLRQPLPPDVGHAIEALAAAGLERLFADLLRSRLKSITQPVRNPHKDFPAVLLRSQEHVVAMQTIHVEQHNVGNA